jgi:hypothetical protein
MIKYDLSYVIILAASMVVFMMVVRTSTVLHRHQFHVAVRAIARGNVGFVPFAFHGADVPGLLSGNNCATTVLNYFFLFSSSKKIS